MSGIQLAVEGAGFTVVVWIRPADSVLEELGRRLLTPDRVDALAVNGAPLTSDHIQAISGTGLPLIVLGPEAPGVWSVAADSRGGTEAAISHLFEIGRRRVVHIGGPLHGSTSRLKREGYRLAHERLAIDIDPSLHDVDPELHSRERGWRVIERLIRDGVAFDAVYADDDLLAMGAIGALNALGRRVPEDVSVVGYGGLKEARVSRPPLTTVDVDFRQQGWLAGTILTRLLADSSPGAARVLLHTRLSVRESSVPGSATSQGEPGEMFAGGDR